MSTVDFKSILSPLISGDIAEPENSIWVVYAAVVVEAVASAKHITDLWNYVAAEQKDVPDKQIPVARRIREGLLKCSPLAGFPKVLSS